MEPISTIRFEPRAPRRVVTAPAGVPPPENGPPRSDSGTVETLYVHPDVKIISFSADGDAASNNGEMIRPLPSISSHERTIAVGLFRIYRAPGSVAFLNCGSALKPIMPKGQCWSITDTNSKFVLQIRRPNYWRIELPDSSEEDLEKARALRAVFHAVLQFEKTPCPFQRSFTVPLPENPPEPAKKKQWAPVPQRLSVDYSRAVEVAPLPAKILDIKPRPDTKPRHPINRDSASCLRTSSPDAISTHQNGLTDQDHAGLQLGLAQTVEEAAEGIQLTDGDFGGKHSEWPFEAMETALPPEKDFVPTTSKLEQAPSDAQSPATTSEGQGREGSYSESNSEELTNLSTTEQQPAEDVLTFDAIEGSGTAAGGKKAKLRRRRHTGLGTLRSAPSAPQLTLIASPPSKSTQKLTVKKDGSKWDDGGRTSPTLSSDSFHSTQSWLSPITPLPPSPPILQSDDSQKTFPFPHDYIALPTACRANSKDPTTPGTPDTNSGQLSVSSALDRTPTQPHPRHRRTAGDSQQTDCVSGRLEAPNGIHPFVTETTRDRGFSTMSERTVVRRRALSPLPPAATMFHAQSEGATIAQNARITLGALPMLLIAKTCGLLLRPPSYLISLMLRIAARITAGEWRGNAMGYDPTGENIPVDWDYSDSEWEEALGETRIEQEQSKAEDADDQLSLQGEDFEDANQSWEVD